MKTTILGYPRIGARRELKFATENYWAGTIDAARLETTAAQLRRSVWTELRDAGLDTIPSNTFSLYDQVLDTTVMIDAVPARYRGLSRARPLLRHGARHRRTAAAGDDEVVRHQLPLHRPRDHPGHPLPAGRRVGRQAARRVPARRGSSASRPGRCSSGRSPTCCWPRPAGSARSTCWTPSWRPTPSCWNGSRARARGGCSSTSRRWPATSANARSRRSSRAYRRLGVPGQPARRSSSPPTSARSRRRR